MLHFINRSNHLRDHILCGWALFLIFIQNRQEKFHQKNQRTYGLVRASNAGGVSMPYVIYNDYYNHEDFITALINSGFAGVLWTPEVRASKTAEEWLRRF